MKKNWIRSLEMVKEIFTVKFVRILIFMFFAALLFYVFSPKYQSHVPYNYRFNKITGTTENLQADGRWETRKQHEDRLRAQDEEREERLIRARLQFQKGLEEKRDKHA